MVFALRADVGDLQSRDEHENPDSGRLRPDLPLVVQAAGDLAAAATTTLEVISHYPEGLLDIQIYLIHF
jgi:hypothetical protein